VLKDIYFLPVKNKVLLHAPLHGVSAVVNKSGAYDLQNSLNGAEINLSSQYQALKGLINEQIPPPMPRIGRLNNPRFLGIITSRKCNMACRYCDFPSTSKDEISTMSMETCKNAIDTYFKFLSENKHTRASIHFFGGEPFIHPELVFFAVEYSLYQSRQQNFSLHLEATSNGLVDPVFAKWISEVFNCVVLSLDGKEEIQNLQRPTQASSEAFHFITQTAKTLSDSACNLIIRSCITQESLPELNANVHWIADEFRPETICLEPMSITNHMENIGLHPPDPWEFSKSFLLAEIDLRSRGIDVMLSTADLSLTTVSSCPVGHDALIISPNGEINACYLPKQSWLTKGKPMHLGKLENGKFKITQSNLEKTRQYQVGNKSLCENCFSRYHCAGGCHVNHNTNFPAGKYDNLCIRTRLVSIGKLLNKIGQYELLRDWLADDQALQTSALWHNDHYTAWS
jgi:uncharacterized protein